MSFYHPPEKLAGEFLLEIEDIYQQLQERHRAAEDDYAIEKEVYRITGERPQTDLSALFASSWNEFSTQTYLIFISFFQMGMGCSGSHVTRWVGMLREAAEYSNNATEIVRMFEKRGNGGI